MLCAETVPGRPKEVPFHFVDPTWNLMAWTFGRRFSSTTQWFSGSMLNFQCVILGLLNVHALNPDVLHGPPERKSCREENEKLLKHAQTLQKGNSLRVLDVIALTPLPKLMMLILTRLIVTTVYEITPQPLGDTAGAPSNSTLRGPRSWRAEHVAGSAHGSSELLEGFLDSDGRQQRERPGGRCRVTWSWAGSCAVGCICYGINIYDYTYILYIYLSIYTDYCTDIFLYV